MKKKFDPRLFKYMVLFELPVSGVIMAVRAQIHPEGWEHVAVAPAEIERTPTWEEMCAIKDMFWDPEEYVIQYHPPKSQYVNIDKFCLHLWKPIGQEIPAPPKVVVLTDPTALRENLQTVVGEIVNDEGNQKGRGSP